jgi:hypothetical protein
VFAKFVSSGIRSKRIIEESLGNQDDNDADDGGGGGGGGRFAADFENLVSQRSDSSADIIL